MTAARPAYAELHCHCSFSFLDGASPPDELIARAMELELSALAVTDHQGLYGVVRFAAAAQEAGVRPVIGIEVELLDSAAPDPAGVVVPARRPRTARPRSIHLAPDPPREGRPARPRPVRMRLPGYREPVKEDLRGIGEGQRGPHLVLLARNAAGYRSLCRLVSRANLAGTKSMPRFTQELLAGNAEGVVALSGCRDGEIARRLRAGDPEGARLVAQRYARLFGGARGGVATRGGVAARGGVVARGGDSPRTAGFFVELQHHLLPDDDWLVEESARLATELGLPTLVTNDVHYAYPEGRELQDVLTAIRHGRTLDELRDLRRPDGESYLKSGAEMAALSPGALAGAAPPGRDLLRAASGGSDTQKGDAGSTAAWAEGIANTSELAASCSVDLGFERYRFPGFPVPKGHTPFSYLEALCHEGARRRYHPISAPVIRQLAHELDVIERTGLAEFFLICWDLMRFARSRGIPAQGRGSAADSIVAYVLGITRVDPIRHNLLFERFINEGRTTYPDVDIDFSSERREEVIQYVYQRYGPEHTGMVCNLVTYRARSAVREVGYALGFPRPLVDRVAKALETYDSVMVRRDLEAEGGFNEFFAKTVREADPPQVGPGGRTDLRGSNWPHVESEGAESAAPGDRTAADGGSGDHAVPVADPVAELAGERGLVDRMGQLNHPRGGRIGVPTPRSGPNRSYMNGGSAIQELGNAGQVKRPFDAPKHSAARSVREISTAEPGRKLVESASLGQSGGAVSIYYSSQEYRKGSAPDGRASTPDGRASTPDGRVSDLGGGSAVEQQRRLARRRPIGSDDEGGPGDSAASVAWLARERAEAREWAEARERSAAGAATAATTATTAGRLGTAGTDTTAMTATNPTPGVTGIERPEPHSSVARVQPQAPMPPDVRRGSTKDMPHWERWLAMCARIDGFPRHLSIHSGGMLVTAAPLIDIAPLERATMPDRVVVQFDKRDVETIKLIKLDLLGLGMLAAIDETLQLIERDCKACVDLDRLPEDVPEVFDMLRAADTVGVFQVESRAQMQTLPKSRPANLDDLVVEVAIIRPGPIQGNAVHPYLRRRQGLEPVAYLHPSLEPVLRETLGVILYQEQVMQIAIGVAGFSAGESDGFRRAMGTWRSSREMEKLHARFVDGCKSTNGLTDEQAEELFRQVAAFASFGFAKSHAAAFARTAYESSFLKLFYPAQFTVGLINAQPMGFYPVEVLINDAKRHGVAVLPVDVNRSTYKTVTERVEPGRQAAVQSSGCIVPSAESRATWASDRAMDCGIRLGLALVNGIGEEHAERLDAELARGPYRSLADVVARTALPEETIERLIRAGALDSLGKPRRELLWQLREVMGASRGSRIDGWPKHGRSPVDGNAGANRRRPANVPDPCVRSGGRAVNVRARGLPPGARPLDLHLPPTPAPELPPLTERERLGDSYAVLALDAQRQVISLFRPALDRIGAVTNASLADRGPGPVKLGGLVVTRQHPMTARGTVFLALEDETGMVNVTLWPDAWARLRGVVRRHALLYVEGMLQREANVVNVIAREVKPLPEVAGTVGGPARPEGVKALGYTGMRRGR